MGLSGASETANFSARCPTSEASDGSLGKSSIFGPPRYAFLLSTANMHTDVFHPRNEEVRESNRALQGWSPRSGGRAAHLVNSSDPIVVASYHIGMP